MENLENNVVNNEIQENTEVEAKEVKTFTQDELNKIVAERIAKERKKLDAERLKQQEIQEKLIEEESEKLAKMTEAEKIKAKAERERKRFEDKVAKYEAEMKAFEQEKIKNQTMKLLGEKGLPVELCQFIQSNTADEIMENVEVFEKCWSEAIEKSVNARLRTSGELRTSNFLPWQIVYSEFVFVEKNWPDFEEKDLDEAIEIYQKRNRKFGAK